MSTSNTYKYGKKPLPLHQSHVRVRYTPSANETVQQPSTRPIANFPLNPTPPPITSGRTIASNTQYIAYGAKNGLVRVINVHSAKTTLLRGHSIKLLDVSFLNSASNVMSTVGAEGNVLLWKIINNGDEFKGEILLQLTDTNATRIIWHPSNPNEFILLHATTTDGAYVPPSIIESTKLKTVMQDNHAFCDYNTVSDSTTRLYGAKGTSSCSPIVDLAWCKNSRYILTSHQDGTVSLWDLSQIVNVDLGGKKITSAKCISSFVVEEDGVPVDRIILLQQFDDIVQKDSNNPSSKESFLTNPFVTTSHSGTCMTLWSPFTTSGLSPTKLATFQLHHNGQYLADVITLPKSNLNTQPSTFLILADQTKGSIFALHISSSSSSGAQIINGFDYIIPFTTKSPIYSWYPRVSTSSISETSDVGEYSIDLYCMQSNGVQLLSLSEGMMGSPPQISSVEGLLAEGVEIVEDSISGSDDVEEMMEEDFEEEEYDISDGGDDDDNDEDVEYEEYDDEEESARINDANTTLEHTPQKPIKDEGGSKLPITTSSFSNWLGNLTGKASVTTTNSSSVPSTPFPNPPPNTPIVGPTTSGTIKDHPGSGLLSLCDIPLPDAPEVSSTPNVSLLSPTEILGMAGKKEVDLSSDTKIVKQETVEKRLPTKSEMDMKGVQKVSSSNYNGKSSKKSNKITQPVPIPKDGKIEILKRESGPPTNLTAVSTTPKKEVDVSSDLMGGVLKAELEDIVSKVVSSQFAKQEANILSEVQKTIRSELTSFVIPALSNTISQTIDQSIHKSMKSSFAKQSKEGVKIDTDSVSESISNKLQEQMSNTFYQSMREVFIPAYESGTRQMLSQISKWLEKSLEEKQRVNNETVKYMDVMSKRMDGMAKTIEVLTEAVGKLSTSQGSSGAQMSVAGSNVAKNEDIRNQILVLLNAQEYEKAFAVALTVSDTEMAVFVCKNSDIGYVLESDTPKLSQPILLCLMQQLSVCLVGSKKGADIETCVEWLQSIAVTLNPHDENIRKHVGNVSKQIVDNINAKMAEGHSNLRRPLQMLLQVVRGIGNS